MCAWGGGGVEERDGDDAVALHNQLINNPLKRTLLDSAYFVRPRIHLVNEFLLRDEIVVRVCHGLGQARCAAAEESGGSGRLRPMLIVKGHPVLLAMVKQFLPRQPTAGKSLALRVEEAHIRVWNPDLVCGVDDRPDDLWLGHDEPSLGRTEVVGDLVRCVGGIRAGEDAACADDGQDEHGI